MSAAVTLRGVEKSYGSGDRAVPVLHGIDLELDAGDLACLMGPSGCGKTTLLHVLGAMDRADAGEVRLGAVDLAQLAEEDLARVRRCDVGFVFQFFNLLPTLSLVENVVLPLLLEARPRGESTERAMHLLERVGLAARAHHRPAQLSGGEMQRGAIARALVAEPQLVLADEPTGSLDSENGERVLDLLDELNRETGITILLATHSREVAERGHKVIHLRDGRVERIEARDTSGVA